MAAEIRSTFEQDTLVLTLSNPEYGNALVPEMCSAGVEVFASAGSNADVRAIVLTGDSATFCGGLTPQRWAAGEAENAAVTDAIERLHDWIEAIRTCPKVVIAAVEGAAAGAGFTLALACDLIVAASNSTFRVGGSGAVPDGGASWFLARGLPRQLTSELLLDRAPVDAERLAQAGIVNRLCEPAEALRAALDWAAQLGQPKSGAVGDIKECIDAATGHSLTQHLALERDQWVRAARTAVPTTKV